MVYKTWLDWLAVILLIVGAVVWGLVGIFNWNLIEAIFGFNWFTRLIYILVGASGIYKLITINK